MRDESKLSSATVRVALFALLSLQAGLGLLQVNELWTRGHNGWNSSAYHQSARNSLRFGHLFPLQYHTGTEEQPPSAVYTHHPLGMHLHNTAAMWFFGDHRAVVRSVAAFFGVLVVWTLFFVVRRLYGSGHAILAGLIYVLSPINAIFVNMANHVSAFTTFALLALYAYVRLNEARESVARGEGDGGSSGRWLVALYAAQALAAFWDWPANYVALVLAAHWLVAGVGRVRRAPAVLRFELASFAGYCTVVLSMFLGHFALVELETGNLAELLHVAGARQGTGGFSWGHHLRTVPLLMFSWPILTLVVAWIVASVVRVARRRLAPRDLVPFTLAVVGITHYVVFRQSAVVHEFWAWHALPFVAIACATALIASGRFVVDRLIRRLGETAAAVARARVVAAVSLTLFMAPFALHVARVVPEGRRVGGAMWFVAPVRGPEPSPYDSGRAELTFAELVNEWTTRDTGVLVSQAFYRIVPEPRWEITLDRELRRVHRPPRAAPAGDPGGGWVFIGRLADLSPRDRTELASRHPFTEVGPFFMVDLRRGGADERRFDLVPGEITPAHAYFVSPFEAPLELRPTRGD